MAKSRSIGSIYASLTLRDASFKKGLSSAGAALAKFGATSAKIGVGLAAGMGTAAAAGLAAGTLRTLDQVDALGDLSAQTGVAISDMMKLQQAYKDGGRGAEMAGKDIGKMQKTIVEAASGGADPFKAIGLSAAELLKKNPAAQFEEIGDAIMRITNPAERTAKAMDIFGKSGAGLATVFPGIKEASASLGSWPAMAQKFGAAMGTANDIVGRLPGKGDQFVGGFTAGIIGQLLPSLEKINDPKLFDFAKRGEELGRALATGFQGLTDGRVFEVMSLKAASSTTKIAAYLGSGLSAAINAAADEFDNAFNPAGNKTLLAMKAVGRDFLTLGADPETRKNALATNIKEWEESKNFEEQSFGDNFAKYMKEGPDKIFANTAEMFSQNADQIWNRMSSEYGKKLAAASALGDKGPPPKNPLEGLSAAAALLDRQKEPVINRGPRMEVNDYQRRGLQLEGAMGSTAKEDKQTALIERGVKMLENLWMKPRSAQF